MEEICAALSTVLNDGGNSYKIYYEEDLLDALPDDVRNRDTLEAALKNLHGGGFIDVKYARGSAFCIASLKKFVPKTEAPAEEKSADEAAVTTPSRINKALCFAVALSAFLGGAVGGGIAALIGAVI